MPAPTEPPITVYGWELHLTGPSTTQRGSDKYYRVLIIGNTTLVNYGRRESTGQFIAHRFPTGDGAKAKARELTNEKSGKGYVVTRDMTDFEVPAARVRFTTKLPLGPSKPSGVDGAWLVDRFKTAAAEQGTVENGASR